eukprot:15478107-Alexandrium_andersonii.AAC.1
MLAICDEAAQGSGLRTCRAAAKTHLRPSLPRSVRERAPWIRGDVHGRGALQSIATTRQCFEMRRIVVRGEVQPSLEFETWLDFVSGNLGA